MRILMISTALKATPPRGYGGIERVVSILTEELVRQGHDVTLVATPGSRCSGRTVEVAGYDPGRAPSTVRRRGGWMDEEPLYAAARELIRSGRFDVVHDWSFQNHVPLRHGDEVPAVVSLCFPPPPAYRRPNLVACSRAHAELCGPSTRFVHYGLPLADWTFSPKKDGHLVHIAKIARYKAQHLAVRAARRAGRELHLVGNVEDRWYFHTRVKPALWRTPSARYVGEARGTASHLAPAAALVQTPRWFDAFPVVVLEALASGTPVIAFPSGGIPEQVVPGATGFLCETVDELAEAMERVDELDPADCRASAEERFSASRMAADYVELYQRVRDGERW